MSSDTIIAAGIDRAARGLSADARIGYMARSLRVLPTRREQAIALGAAMRAYLGCRPAPGPLPQESAVYHLFGADADDVAVTVGAACRALGIPFEIVVRRQGQALTCWVQAEVEPGVTVDIDPLRPPPETPEGG